MKEKSPRSCFSKLLDQTSKAGFSEQIKNLGKLIIVKNIYLLKKDKVEQLFKNFKDDFCDDQ